MFYTYKNCKITLNGENYIATNLSLDINAENEPLYYANQKYSHYGYVPVNAVGGIINFQYYLTGQDPIKSTIYREDAPIRGDFGGLAFESGYVTSYQVGCKPNSSAVANVSVNFFDHLTGSFSPITGEEPSENEILNFSNVTVNGTGLGDYATIISAGFNYSNDVQALYAVESGKGKTNLKPDRIVFGKRVLSTNVDYSVLSGEMSLYGNKASLGLHFTREGESEAAETLLARGHVVQKSVIGDGQSISQTRLSIKQDGPSEIAYITGFTPKEGSCGDVVTVSGYGFLSHPLLFIGNYQINDYELISDILLTFKAPCEPVGDGTLITQVGTDAEEKTESEDTFVQTFPALSITQIHPPTGQVGTDMVSIRGENFTLIDTVQFSPTGMWGDVLGAQYTIINQQFIQVLVPFSGQMGPVRVASSILGKEAVSTQDFIPKPEIRSVSTLSPSPATDIVMSGLAFSGVTGVFFGEYNENWHLNPTGTVFSGDVTDIRQITVHAPEGDLGGNMILVGRSGLHDVVGGVSTSSMITGILPTGGKQGDDVILSGVNFVSGSLQRVTHDDSNPDWNLYNVDFGGVLTGYGISGTLAGYGEIMTGKVPIGVSLGVQHVRLRNLGGSLHPSGVYFNVRQDAPQIESIVPATGTPDGRRLGPTVHTVTGQYLSGITGFYMYPSGSGFNLEGAQNLLTGFKDDPSYILFDTLSNTSFVFSTPSGISGVATSGSQNLVTETQYGTGVALHDFFIKYEPSISGFGPRAAAFGEMVQVTGRGYFGDTTEFFLSGVGQGALGRRIYGDISGIFGDPTSEAQVLHGRIPGLTASTPFKVCVDNGVDIAISDEEFGFVGAPEIKHLTPESGTHGDTVIISGTSLRDVTTLRHGIVPISEFVYLNPMDPTGMRFTVPHKFDYQAYDSTYKNTTNYIYLEALGGLSQSTGEFETIPEDIVCSGFSPWLAQRGEAIVISGGNIALTTGVLFTGKDDGVRISQPITNDGFVSQLIPTGEDYPKTGLIVRVPGAADNGELILKGHYSECQTSDELIVDVSVSLTDYYPGSGIVGQTITLEGFDLHKSKYYVEGISSGTLDLSEPIVLPDDGTVRLNKYPEVTNISPLQTRYLTDGDGEEYVEIDWPNVAKEQASIFSTRVEIEEPTIVDFRPVGANIKSLPLISGISATEIRVGETLYVTGMNCWDTLANSVMISGTGIRGRADTALREMEFLSQYNTKLEDSIQDGEIVKGRKWVGFGDHFIPNDPQTLEDNEDLSWDGMAAKYNAAIRSGMAESGLNTPTSTDGDPFKTGTWVLPIEIGENFIGTGFVFIPFHEYLLTEGHHQLVEKGPDTVTTNLGGVLNDAQTFYGRIYDTYDLKDDGVIDPFMWSGQTTGTDFQYSGKKDGETFENDTFYKHWTGSHTANQFDQIVFKKHTLIVRPAIYDVTGFDTQSGCENAAITVRGVGMNLTKSGAFFTGDSTTEVPISITAKTTGSIDFTLPSISWPTDIGFVSGQIILGSQYSVDGTTDLEPEHRRYVQVVRPPTLQSMDNIEGIEGKTPFTLRGINLQYATSLWMTSQMDGDTIVPGIWEKAEEDGKTIITGMTPTGVTVLPQDFSFAVSASAVCGYGSQIETYTIVEGDVTIHGNLFVDYNAYIGREYGILDVSGEYMLEGDPLEAGDLPGNPIYKKIQGSGHLLHLSAESEASYSGGNVWHDISRYTQHATLYNSPTFEKGELEFDGDDQYGVVPMASHLQPDQFTLGVFFRPLELGGTLANTIFEAPNTEGTILASYKISFDSSSRIFSYLTFTDGTSSTIFSDPVVTGDYYLVNTTWDGQTHSLYLSGELYSSVTAAGKTVSYKDSDLFDLNILSNSTHSKQLKAELRDIHLYSGALDREQIFENYKRLTSVRINQKDLEISGGKILLTQREQTGNFGVYEDNQIFLSGTDAAIWINGLKLDPGDEYTWRDLHIGEQMDITGVSGTTTSTLLATDTKVGTVSLDLPELGDKWKHIKVNFGAFLNTADNMDNVFVQVGSDKMDWPRSPAYQMETTNNESDNLSVSYILEGAPHGHYKDNPLVLDVYASLGSSFSDDDVASRRSLYAVGTYVSGSGHGNWTFGGGDNSNFNFYPNTGLANAFGMTLTTGGYYESTTTLRNAFPLQYTEDNVNRVYVSLDGINLVPTEDYNLIGFTGVQLKSSPSIGEEICVRQITPTIGTHPLNVDMYFNGMVTGLTFMDLSTGTNFHFSGGISGLAVENYNIYDSNVSITGDATNVYNQWTGINVDIDNIGTATATNIYNEPGGASTITSHNANVVVANEGTTVFIDENSANYIYASTGIGKVFVTGGTNLLTGNIYVTGGQNVVTGQIGPISIYDSTNTINLHSGFTGDSFISGTTNYIYNSGSGVIQYISGEMNIYNSLLTGFTHDNSNINVYDGGVVNMAVQLLGGD